MAIYEFKTDTIEALKPTSFSALGLREREDIQRLLREHIDSIAPGTLVIAEEFGDWDGSRSRIDLLAIDSDAKLVVIELKRTEDGGRMDLQAVRYAAMVASMTFEEAVKAFEKYRVSIGQNGEGARDELLNFLDWPEPDEANFGQQVRLVLASAEFSKELTTSVLWLANQKVDISCVRMKPYKFGDTVLVDIQQIIPLPEAAQYQVRVQAKAMKERESRESSMDRTKYDVRCNGQEYKGLGKGAAILQLCHDLVATGVAPEEIGLLLHPTNPARIWHRANGELDSVAFIEFATGEAEEQGGNFDTRRWFLSKNKLVAFNGDTYALSNQWGGPHWEECMQKLKDEYSVHGIDFSPTEDA